MTSDNCSSPTSLPPPPFLPPSELRLSLYNMSLRQNQAQKTATKPKEKKSYNTRGSSLSSDGPGSSTPQLPGNEKCANCGAEDHETWLECSACTKWYCLSCLPYTDDEIALLDKPEVYWLCKDCVDKPPTARDNSLAQLFEEKFTSLSNRLDLQFTLINQALERKADRSELAEVKMDLLQTVDATIDTQINEKFKEIGERERRKLNITMGGVPENTSSDPAVRQQEDIAQVEYILSRIGATSNVERVCRIGQKSSNLASPRLSIITMKDLESKNSALKNSHKIKSCPDLKNNITIRSDYTPQQQSEVKTLISELCAKQETATDPKNWKIDYRRWKVVHLPSANRSHRDSQRPPEPQLDASSQDQDREGTIPKSV